ncbi:MAG: hypothetical protein U0805_12990 [Pirellulales bacterium]
MRSSLPVIGAMTLVAAALLLGRALAEEYPSEEWQPRPSEVWCAYPSETWSPRVAALPEQPAQAAASTGVAVRELPAPSSANDAAAGSSSSPPPIFGTPPLEDAGWLERPVIGTTPNVPPCATSPGCGPWPMQSYFMPALGRFGLVAPRTPGVDSVHSAYVLTPPCVPPPCGPPSPCANLFAAPPIDASDCGQNCALQPGGWVGAAGEPPAAASQTTSPPPSAKETTLTRMANPPEVAREQPCLDPRAQLSPYSTSDFSADPFYDQPYDTCAELGVYGDKYLNPTQRPLVEWGVPLYDTGPVPPPSLDCGPTNPSLPRFYLYGDYRAAAATNDQNGNTKGVIADRLNLEWDLWLTSTERFHMFTGPMQRGNNFQRVEFDDGSSEFFDEMDFFDANTDTAYFEGDLGYMLGGWSGKYAQFDMPVSVGLIPLLFQNGVWMEDAIVGAAATIPARNSPFFDWSNFDVTFFTGFDQVTSPAFEDSNAAANLFGATTFIEAKGGYIELGYAYLDDTANLGRSYNNIGISYTRRYLNLLSNSMRVIVNSGQGGPVDDRTANGLLLIAENSFLTPWPYNVIPYVNLWSGFDDPQSVARAGAAGGVLRNTGILFESDNLTGYPTLDATAANTWGAAVGLNLLSPEFTQQLVLEAAAVQVFGDPDLRNAAGDQYGVGARYQIPLSNATLLRFDVMHGFLDNAPDISGARAEFRWKF